ncbi:PilZ domain-containing protein [Salidesulfovibrio brasiliensis]|uniref:PilZ domain-containing protein n=1 Tax=Salidesulfovibrio brasiliensis TaxID=221711 RepID=UPI0006D02917|nr:PilZ domain-containing protein [Salidesulfovibrio brasiliensis]
MELLTDIQRYIDGPLTELLSGIFGLSSPEQVRMLLAGALAVLAVVLLLAALSFMRSGRRKGLTHEEDIPAELSRKGAAIDVTMNDDTSPALRCVITRAGRKRLQCDILDRNGKDPQQGDEVSILFPPTSVNGTRINVFSATAGKADAERIVLETPRHFGYVKRREHVRKKVMDQQFIRVRLWVSPMDSTYEFQDSPPDVGVNSYAQDDSGHEANTVINISNGGMALNVRNQNLPPACVTGGPVVLNIFLFNFREKEFKPYWCAGEIRSMEGGEEGYTRVGIAFTGSGSPREDGCIDWGGKSYPPSVR